MQVKAVVFDFDGVLADSEPIHFRVYQELLAPSGVTLTKDAYCERYLGFDDEGAFRQMASDFNLLLGDEEIEMLIVAKARRFEEIVSGTNVLYPTAVACVERLGARWPLGIAYGLLIVSVITGAIIHSHIPMWRCHACGYAYGGPADDHARVLNFPSRSAERR